MKTVRRVVLLLTILIIGLVSLIACARSPLRTTPLSTTQRERLTPSEQVAGETLAYLLQVVLGRAGPLDKRADWATRGLGLPLDFDMVQQRMFGPVPLRAELMVLDTNILGLLKVVYHFDQRLNLFKGSRAENSLYPCTELIALRLLLLKKLHRKEKVRMAGVDLHRALFAPGSRDAGVAELQAMQLSGTEFRFLKAIFTSEPAFLRYMRHPFLVAALRKIGVVEQDPFTLSADLTATYDQWACKPSGSGTGRQVTLAVLPGMNPMFTAAPETGALTPTTEYLALQRLVQTTLAKKMDAAQGTGPVALHYFTPNRPVVIIPENADRVLGQLCPKADFTVVLMGKNVYRGLSIDPRKDTLPHRPILYLDTDDVRYNMVDEELGLLADAVQTLHTGS